MNYIPHRLALGIGFAICDAMVGDRRGGSAREAHTVLQQLSEKHISLDGISDAISEIFPALLLGGLIFLMMMLDL